MIERTYYRPTILLFLLILAFPLYGTQQLSATLRESFTDLSDAWATCVGQHCGASFFKKFGDLISLDCCPNLLRSWCTEKGDLEKNQNQSTAEAFSVPRPASSIQHPLLVEPSSRRVSVRRSMELGCAKQDRTTMSS